MLWFVLGLIISVVICVYKTRTDFWFDAFEGFIVFVMALLLSVTLFIISSGSATCCADVDFTTISEKKIIALKDNQNVNGQIYLCGGYVEEEMYFYYAEETELGYKTDKIKAQNCYIQYTDGEAYIEEQKAGFTNELVKVIASPLCSRRYIIYCPEDTVTVEFKVDLE